MRHFNPRKFIFAVFPILLLLSLYQPALGADIKLAWDPNTESDLAGYKVYYGPASGTYGTPLNVGNVTTYTLTGLTYGQTYFIAVTAYDTSDRESGYSNEVSGTANDSETVSTPSVLSGPTSGTTGTSYTYTTGGSSSNLGHSVQYQFDWKGDGTDLSSWGSTSQSKAWSVAGTYNVRSRARCSTHTTVVSNWSSSLTVSISLPPQSYTVTTNPSGRQITVDSVNYTAPRTFSWTPGSNHTLSVTSPQNGSTGTQYVYASWSDGGARTHTITAPSSGTTYTASFTTQYSLTTSVSPSAGGTVSPSGTNWYNSAQSVSISATANAGYTFANWSGDFSGSTNPASIGMNGPKNVVANFTQNQYTLAVNINPSGSGLVSKNPDKSTYVYGEQITLTATANSGYTFSSWSGDITGTGNPFNLTINGNKTVTANFSNIPETISTPTVPSGPTTGTTGTSYTYTTGGATSSLGHSVQYQFDWKGDGTDLSSWGSATQSKTWAVAGTYNVRARARCSTHTSVVSSWSGARSITVSLGPQSYTVTTNPSNPSAHQITVDDVNYTAPQTFSWTPGSTHKLSAPSPQNGTSGTRYVYSSWSDGGAQTHYITVPSSGTTYTANFTTQYSLTTSVSPSAGGTVSPSGTNWYNSAQSVSISATANAGYTFANWSGDLSGSTNPVSIGMNGPKNLVANFETISTPTVPSGPTTGNTNSSNSYSTGGSSSNLGHTVEYQFDWKGDGTDLSSWGSGTQSKTWIAAGTYNVRARARCITHTSVVSSWSGSISVTISSPPISHTVTTNPSGLDINVDGVDYIAPQTFSWTPGSSHTLHASSPQPRNPASRYVYVSWSDGGGQTHTITASSSNSNHTADFKKQHKFKASAEPPEGGAITANGTVITSSDSNYYDSDQNITILATASSGYGFTGWEGDLSGTTNPVYVNMSEPKTVIAHFTPIPGATTLVSPSGTIFISAPTYTWNAVAESTWYYLWVNDSTGAKIQQWYTAADAGCASGTGTCSATPAIALTPGACQWKVQTYSSGGYGPWSSPMSFTVSPPGVATLASPSGEIADTTPTYTWNAISAATWYHLYVNDSTGNKVNQWYTADACGCASGTGSCSVTPTTEVLGSCEWWLQAYNSAGIGPWSAPLAFTVPPPAAATLVSPSGTITDTTPTYIWNAVSNATWYCISVNDSTGNKIYRWYSADACGCASGTGSCSITPTTVLAQGLGQWWIRTYNAAGFGPWSAPMSFTVSP